MLTLDENCPTEVRNYFDPRSIGSLLENVEKISRFMENQNRGFVKKNSQFRTNYFKCKQSFMEVKDFQKKLVNSIARENEFINRLRKAYK